MAQPPKDRQDDTRYHTMAGQDAAFCPRTGAGHFRFATAQGAWLGFMALHQIVGEGPADKAVAPALIAAHQRVLGILDEAYRGRRLLIDHLRVLRFYGLKGRPPRLWVPREARAHTLWGEALDILRPSLAKAGYIADAFSIRWQEEMVRLQNGGEAAAAGGRETAQGFAAHAPDEVR